MNKDEAYQRLIQAIEYLKDNGMARSHEEIAERAGLTRPNVTAALNGNYARITEGTLRRIADAYSDLISKDWLVKGTGQMEIPDASMRPHFAASVSAGFTATISDPESAPELRALGADLPEYDFTISVSGDSMTPLIDDGDTLACRIETDRANPPVGKICVIDRAGGPVVKIIRSAREGNLILHSLNPAHPDFAVPVSEVLSISRVVGLIRTM